MTTITIKKKDLVPSPGPMARNTMETGAAANNTDGASIHQSTGKREVGYGQKGKESNGLMITFNKSIYKLVSANFLSIH